MIDRIDFKDGQLDEIVSTKGAHLEHMGGTQWFLSFQHADGSETAVWFSSKSLLRPMVESRPPSALSVSSPTPLQEQNANSGKEEE